MCNHAWLIFTYIFDARMGVYLRSRGGRPCWSRCDRPWRHCRRRRRRHRRHYHWCGHRRLKHGSITMRVSKATAAAVTIRCAKTNENKMWQSGHIVDLHADNERRRGRGTVSHHYCCCCCCCFRRCCDCVVTGQRRASLKHQGDLPLHLPLLLLRLFLLLLVWLCCWWWWPDLLAQANHSRQKTTATTTATIEPQQLQTKKGRAEAAPSTQTVVRRCLHPLTLGCSCPCLRETAATGLWRWHLCTAAACNSLPHCIW
eukprot:COSAG05_NODE_38_length_27626_cov_78.614306_18_plen_257_part_00